MPVRTVWVHLAFLLIEIYELKIFVAGSGLGQCYCVSADATRQVHGSRSAIGSKFVTQTRPISSIL